MQLYLIDIYSTESTEGGSLLWCKYLLGVDEAVLPSDVGDFDGAVSVGCKSG